jgi:hypothetical protein
MGISPAKSSLLFRHGEAVSGKLLYGGSFAKKILQR